MDDLDRLLSGLGNRHTEQPIWTILQNNDGGVARAARGDAGWYLQTFEEYRKGKTVFLDDQTMRNLHAWWLSQHDDAEDV